LSSFDKILFGAPKIVMVPVHEDKHFTIGLFIFPPKAKMPLHDHPNMTVLSRILYGKMFFKAYDWVPTHYTGPVTPTSHLRPKLAKMVSNSVVTPSTPTHVTHKDHGGNVHSFSATEHSALLDVIIPPYNDTDRKITYFEECDNEDETDEEDDDEFSEDEDEDEEELDENGKPVQKAWLLPGDPPEDYFCIRATEEDIDNFIYQPKPK
jgi:cysteamine dioxygenase